MRPRIRSWRVGIMDLLTLTVILCATGVAAHRVFGSRPDPSPLLGRTLSSVQLLPVGDTVTRSLDFAAGVPQVLFLYRVGCGACDAQKSGWLELAARLPRDVPIHAIAMTTVDARLPYLGDGRVTEWHPASVRTLSAVLPVAGVPTTMVIDGAGMVRFVAVGLVTEADLPQIAQAARPPYDHRGRP